MSTTDDTNAARRGSGSNDLLGQTPERLADADMAALAAVAHQAGLAGIDLTALARVLDAAQRIAVAAERERWQELAEHLRHCRDCGEEDVARCCSGAALWKAATGRAPEA